MYVNCLCNVSSLKLRCKGSDNFCNSNAHCCAVVCILKNTESLFVLLVSIRLIAPNEKMISLRIFGKKMFIWRHQLQTTKKSQAKIANSYLDFHDHRCIMITDATLKETRIKVFSRKQAFASIF